MGSGRDSIDGLELGSLILQESMRIHSALSRIATLPLQQVRPPAKSPAAADAGADPPGEDAPMASALELMREAERLLIHHPVVSQRAFSSLAAEGRRFAESPEGARWLRALERSDLVQKARRVWSGSLLNVLEESPEARLPSAYLELIFNSLRAGDRQIDDLLAGLSKSPPVRVPGEEGSE